MPDGRASSTESGAPLPSATRNLALTRHSACSASSRNRRGVAASPRIDARAAASFPTSTAVLPPRRAAVKTCRRSRRRAGPPGSGRPASATAPPAASMAMLAPPASRDHTLSFGVSGGRPNRQMAPCCQRTASSCHAACSEGRALVIEVVNEVLIVWREVVPADRDGVPVRKRGRRDGAEQRASKDPRPSGMPWSAVGRLLFPVR